MRWSLVAGAVFVVALSALAINALFVDARTRPAKPRSGGVLIKTDIATVNVKAEGEGPPIVLIHGFGAALDWWDEIAPSLAQDHRVIRFDLIGHGGTEAKRHGYDIELQAVLVRAVLDRLGVESAIVVGHSMGGEVAIAFADANRDVVQKLVLIDTPPNPEGTFSTLSRLAFTPLLGPALWHLRSDAILRRGLAQGFAPGFKVPDRFVADLWQLTFAAFRHAHAGSVAFVAAEPAPARLAKLDRSPPLLVLFGTEDALIPVTSAEQFATVPGAELVMIDGAGHSPMVEKPMVTLEAMKRFFAETAREKEQAPR